MTKLFAGVVAVVGFFGATSAYAAAYTFTTLNEPDALFGTFPAAISSNGTVAGTYQQGIISESITGFTYANGTYTSFVEPNAEQGGTGVNGINGSNVIVGGYFQVLGGDNGYVYNGTTFTTLDVPFTYNFNGFTFNDASIAMGINDAGTIVGQYFDGPVGPSHGYIDQGGVFTSFDDPNGVGSTVPTSIANDGAIAGYYTDSSGITHGFTDVGGVFKTVDDSAADAVDTQIYGINDEGDVSGTYTDASGGGHGFVMVDGAFITLNDPNANTILGGPDYETGARGLNDAGQIVGFYLSDGDYYGYIATPESTASVPTPGALALLATGLLAMGWLGTRATRARPLA